MRTVRLDLAGKQYGDWTVLEISHKDKYGAIYWKCKCSCGIVKTIPAGNLTTGRSTSCKDKKYHFEHYTRAKTHGLSRSAEYHIWSSMLRRCENPTDIGYKNYGGRGIRVCEQWHNVENFLADMGARPNDSLSIHRINNDGNYEPGNCKWATRKEQAGNKRQRYDIWPEDEFTHLKVSRQRKLQLRHKKLGLCQLCSMPIFRANVCGRHYKTKYLPYLEKLKATRKAST